MKTLIWISLIFTFAFTACAPHESGEPASVQTTKDYPTPVVTQAGEYQVIQGATKVQDMTVQYDSTTKKMSLRGKMNFNPVGEKKSLSLDVDLSGSSEDNGYIVLKPTGSIGVDGLQLAAKATCLGFNGDCSSSFVDIYVSYHEKIYHHQVESVDDNQPFPGEVKSPDDKTDDSTSADEEQEDDHEDTDGVDSTPGGYIGDVGSDVEKVLGVKPKTTPTTPTPSTPTTPPKAAEPVKPTPKADEPGKPTPKPKTEDPKPSTPQPAPKQDKDQGDDSKSQDQQNDEKPAKVDITVRGNQAVGSVNRGRLENGIDLFAYEKSHDSAGFHILRPERKTYYATSEMAYLIEKMGVYTQTIVPGHILSIGDVSRKTGGALGAHKSHQNGLDADIAFYFKAEKSLKAFATALKGGQPIGDWMMDQQWKLFKYVVSSKFIDRIFIHPALKRSLCQYAVKNGEVSKSTKDGVPYETLRRLIPEANHYNHFHMRVKCSQTQVRCRQMADPAPGTGCF